AQLHQEIAELIAEAPSQSLLTMPSVLLLAGVGVWRFSYREVDLPDNTFVIYGELDEVITLSGAFEWLTSKQQAVTVLLGVGYYFHGAFIELWKQLELYLMGIDLI